MRGGYFIGEVAVGFGSKLIHDDAKHSAAGLARSPARGFHYAKIASGADRIARLCQELTNASRVSIFRILLATFGTAEDSYDSFGKFAHFPASALKKSEPALR